MANLSEPKQTLDCIGLYCPEPLFQTRMQIDTLEQGEIFQSRGVQVERLAPTRIFKKQPVDGGIDYRQGGIEFLGGKDLLTDLAKLF